MAFWLAGSAITSILMYLIALSEMTPEEQNKGMSIEGALVVIIMPLFAWPLYLAYAIFWWSKAFIFFIKESSQNARKQKPVSEQVVTARIKERSPRIETERPRTQKIQTKTLVTPSDSSKAIH